MSADQDRFALHAYVDGELAPDDAADVERRLADDPDARADVAALRAIDAALHARYDGLLAADDLDASRRPASVGARGRSFAWPGVALAASLVVAVAIGAAGGWVVRGHAGAVASSSPSRDVEARLQSFVQTAALSHAVFVPEVRHPVEVPAADEAHLVAWLSKRLAAPVVVPHLGDAGWSLLGGRLLAGGNGPVAQFMYEDRAARRLTLAVSTNVADPATAKPAAAAASFRIADEDGATVFYWIDADYAYALTGRLSRAEMNDLARRVDAQLDRGAAGH